MEPNGAVQVQGVEILKAESGRVTGWGWRCECGDGEMPRVVKKDVMLARARAHFDTKHMGGF